MSTDTYIIDLTTDIDGHAVKRKGKDDDEIEINIEKLDGDDKNDSDLLAQDVSVTGAANIDKLKFKSWDGSGDADVFRIDLSTFTSDFTLEFDKKKDTDKFTDLVILTGGDEATITESGKELLINFLGVGGTPYVLTFKMDIKSGDSWSDVLEFDGPMIPGDVIDGSDGSDGMASQSDVYFDADGDRIEGDNIHDFVRGHGGDDKIFSFGGNDTVYGGDDNDFIRGGSGADLIRGDAGNDFVDGGIGTDTMEGGTGDDVYFVDNLLDVVSEAGGDGTDKVKSSVDFTLGDGFENLTLSGTAANGTGNAVRNVIVGNAEDNGLMGLGGDDLLMSGNGNDTLSGGEGDDRLVGENGDDVLDGDAGADKIEGGSGFDLLDGGSESDRLFGNGGNDTLLGGAGDDTLYGGYAEDVLDGGLGDDILKGGKSADVFVFRIGDGDDKVAGFTIGEDVLRFEGLTMDDLTLTQKSTRTFIEYGDQTLILRDVDAGNLTIDHFDFV